MNEPPTPATARRPRRGDRLELAVTHLDAQGRGVGAVDGCRVAVRTAVPGSRVAVEVRRRRRSRVEARLLTVLDPGPLTRPARCEHFGTCGGCAFQTLDYAAQLAELERRLDATLEQARLAGGVERAPIVGMADPWHYRNKMDFTFGNRRWVEPDEPQGVEAGFALGLHPPGRFDKVLDVRSCALHFAEADGLLASVRELALERDLAPWDTRAHTGLLRHLVLRKGVRTGELLVDLVTSADAPEQVEPLAAALLARHPAITTLVQNVNTRAASIAVGERERVLHGPGVIREELAGLGFTLSANSFFQTNTAGAERLVEIVREEAGLTGGERVHDLYCGAGTLGLALAADAGELVGFEVLPAAVADARRNARENGVGRARFVEGDVRAALAAADLAPPDVAVVDPPRAGLHPAVVGALARLAAPRLVYVSCNPEAAVRDLGGLVAGGYRLRRARPLDLFPHTPHLECVFTLDRERRLPPPPPAAPA